jgi:hypothetical protein
MDKALKALEQLKSIPDPTPTLSALIGKLEHRIHHPPQPRKLGKGAQVFFFEKCDPRDDYKNTPGMAFAIATSKEDAIASIMENACQDAEVKVLERDISAAIKAMFADKLKKCTACWEYDAITGVSGNDVTWGIWSLLSRSEFRSSDLDESLLKGMEASLQSITPRVLPFTHSASFFVRGKSSW